LSAPLISNAPLWRLAWRRFRQRSFQYLLCLLGVALGVAMMISIDLANGSAQRAFELSTDAIAGHTTHRIVAVAPSGVEESVYQRLRRELGFTQAAPIVEGYVLAKDLGNQPMRLVGVDLFAEAPFRDYFGTGNVADGADKTSATTEAEKLIPLLTEPNAIVIGKAVATEYGVALGDRLTLDLAGQTTIVRVVGLVNPANSLTQQALSSLIFADIATAQDILGMAGHLSHIDLIADSPAQLALVQNLLPEGDSSAPRVRLETAEAEKNAVKQMTAAFRLNLTALSLLALVVGMFLIYNTVTFSVVQRRPLFGILRCLGATPGQLFTVIMGEAAVLAVLGSVLGVGLGIVLAQGIVGLITQTINDFYFVVSVQQVSIPQTTLLKGLLVGTAAALLSSLVPAIEAMRTAPQTIMQRSALEGGVRQLLPWLVLAWVGTTIGGIGLLRIPSTSLVLAFSGLFSILLGSALLTPPLTAGAMQLLIPISSQFLGVIGRLAPRDIVRSLSRTSVAIAALMVAVSVIVGVSIMVGSFRGTVVQWLDQTLQADVYVSPPSTTANRVIGKLDPAIVAEIRHWPQLQDVVTYNDADVTVKALSYTVDGELVTKTTERPVKLISAGGDVSHGQRPYAWKRSPNVDPWQFLEAGDGVIISEALTARENLTQPPAAITLDTPAGLKEFPVIAVFYDYSSDRGTVLLDHKGYESLWKDTSVASLGLFVKPGQDVEGVAAQVRQQFQSRQALVANSNRTLRQNSLDIFDRTFAITQALRLLAIIVAFIGVLSALMSLQLERTREVGILRAMGMTPRQFVSMTLLETGIMGSIAGFLAMPLGYALAWILIYVINIRSFGWTLQMQLAPSYFWQAWAVAVIAALLAGVYPAVRMGRMVIATAIREE
jgi:putative ABC transport system permease protein